MKCIRPDITLMVRPRRWDWICRACRVAGQSTPRRTRSFRSLRFGLLSLYPLTWTFGRLLVPLLFSHRARSLARPRRSHRSVVAGQAAIV
jgi:hypothetical protein